MNDEKWHHNFWESVLRELRVIDKPRKTAPSISKLPNCSRIGLGMKSDLFRTRLYYYA